MKIGYARVSTAEQNLDLQRDALKEAGCDRIFEDKVSGVRSDRPELARALDMLRAGDTLVIWRFDRLSRSLKDLLDKVEALKATEVQLVSIQESVDTSTATGVLMFQLFGLLAEFERNLIRERSLAGMEAARARGRKGGRPWALDEKRAQAMLAMYKSREVSVSVILETFGVSKTTLYKYVRAEAAGEPVVV
ncbi:MAG: recombinase family protein [Alphaproteobacteria bacterium GM202ARS2]|nr:recombinase family protein [Alphaproteobacteria bacterium GM202ARS2]